MLHPDTLAYLMKRPFPRALEDLRHAILYRSAFFWTVSTPAAPRSTSAGTTVGASSSRSRRDRLQPCCRDYEQLKAAGAQPHPQVHEGRPQTFWWVNGAGFSGRSVNVLECREEPPQGVPHRFVWVTDLPVSESNFAELGNGGGRLRWKIENEGFNIQKNNGYELEHAYSEHPQAAKNFYLLLQIAHLISQLLEKGLLAKRTTKCIGAVRNVARFLLEELRHIVLGPDQLNRIFERRIQIRFADSS